MGESRYSLESPSKALTCPAVLCIIQLRQNPQDNLVVKRHSSPHRKLKAFTSVLCFLHCSFFIRPQLFTASWMSAPEDVFQWRCFQCICLETDPGSKSQDLPESLRCFEVCFSPLRSQEPLGLGRQNLRKVHKQRQVTSNKGRA